MGNADGADGLAAYAAARGLAVEDGAHLPRTTPLLAEGEVHSVDALVGGWLSKYVEAKIALVSRDDAHFTVAVTHVPKAKRFVPWMLCHRVEDAHLLGRAATGLIGGGDRVDLGSAELDAHYRVYAAGERDDIWFHELFSPAFVVWVVEQAPLGFAFEYVEGTLTVSLLGRRRRAPPPARRGSTPRPTRPRAKGPAATCRRGDCMGIRKAILSVAACALAALALAACGSGGSSTGGGSGSGQEGGTLIGAYSAFPDYLDPALSHSEEGWTATYDTYIPLLTYAHAAGAAGGKVIPGLAAAMPKVSDDGKTYTLTLRKGLKYSNGEPVMASDFTHALERVFVLNSSGSPFYDDIVGAEAFAKTKKGGIGGVQTDDKSGRITIHLTHPRGTFENELALPFVALLPAKTPDEDLSGDPPPATGPYVITHSKPGAGWEYERNPEWAKANGKLMPQIPGGHVDKIKIQVGHNTQTTVNEVESGRVDWMDAELPPDRYAAVAAKYEGTQFRVEPTISTYFFWMNTTQAPFDDVKVRQAVNYAIDPAALERIYSGHLEGAQQIVPTGMPGGKKVELYPHDLKKAKELIAEADPSDRDITVWTDNETQTRDAATYYQGVLEELGFQATLKELSPDNYFSVIGNGSTPDLDTGWAAWFEDYPHPNDFLQPLLSEEAIAPTNTTNLARFADPQLSAKITELGEEPLGSEQEAAYAQLDQEFMEQAPMAPYGSNTLTTFVASDINLEGVVYNPTFGPDLATFEFK